MYIECALRTLHYISFVLHMSDIRSPQLCRFSSKKHPLWEAENCRSLTSSLIKNLLTKHEFYIKSNIDQIRKQVLPFKSNTKKILGGKTNSKSNLCQIIKKIKNFEINYYSNKFQTFFCSNQIILKYLSSQIHKDLGQIPQIKYHVKPFAPPYCTLRFCSLGFALGKSLGSPHTAS